MTDFLLLGNPVHQPLNRVLVWKEKNFLLQREGFMKALRILQGIASSPKGLL